MTAPVIYLPEASSDVDDTFAHYEQRSAGLGERFLKHLKDCVDRIALFPELYGRLRDDVRAAPCRRFPHVVYYRIDEGAVVILGVIHGHRDPRVWQSRI